MANEEAREAVMAKALEAINWRSLKVEEMVAFILGAADASEKAGVRQAREAVETVPVTQSRNAALAAIDALGEDDRGAALD